MEYLALIKTVLISFTCIPFMKLVFVFESLQDPILMAVYGLAAMLFTVFLLVATIPNDLAPLHISNSLLLSQDVSNTNTVERVGSLPTSTSFQKLRHSLMDYIFYSVSYRFSENFNEAEDPRATSGSILKKPEFPMVFRGPTYYLVGFFMWGCVAGMALLWFGSQDTTNIYCANGEKYLASPFGFVSILWNGIVHYYWSYQVLYTIEDRRKHRNITLFWCGSVLASQLVLLGGAVIGPFSNQIKPCIVLSLVFLIVPISVLCSTLNTPRTSALAINIPVSFALALPILYSALSFISILLLFMRLSVALESKIQLCQIYVQEIELHILEYSRTGFVWILISGLYGIPFLIVSIISLCLPGYQWIVDASIIYAGASLQGNIVYMLHTELFNTSRKLKFPTTHALIALLINSVLIGTAYLLMRHCVMYSHFYLNRRPSRSFNEFIKERLKAR